MKGPRFKELGMLAGTFGHEDEARPLESLTEEVMELVLLQTDETWEIPPWSTRKECIRDKQQCITKIIRHLREFGSHWPNDDYLMDRFCELPLEEA